MTPFFGNTTGLLGARLPLGDKIAFVGMHRLETLGAFTDEARRALDALLPPLRRLLTVRQRLDRANAQAADLDAMLDVVSYGVVRCTGQGRIVFANRAALAMLTQQDGLRGLLGGRLGAVDPLAAAGLERAMSRAAATNPPASDAVAIPRSPGRAPYRIVAMPFRRSQGAERTALLLIDDPEKKRPGLSRHVRALYGFTKAEAELALAMTQGLSPDQYAALRDIRITTVRTQIRSMLEKCGITRQIDLVAALVQIPALAPGTEAESGDD